MNSGGVARQSRRQTLLVLRWRKVNYACTLSSALIVGGTTKPTPTNTPSGDTNLIENGNKRNTLRSVETESSRFAP